MTRRLREIVADARDRHRRKQKRADAQWRRGERCSTCAYRPGTEAAGDEADPGLTRVRRALLDAAQPFYCHEPGPVAGARKRLCVGHMEAMSKRYRAGHYDRHPPTAPAVLDELREATRIRDELYNAWELEQ